jgi:hypothetical protein
MRTALRSTILVWFFDGENNVDIVLRHVLFLSLTHGEVSNDQYTSLFVLFCVLAIALSIVPLLTASGIYKLFYNLKTHTSLSSIRRGFAPGFVNYEKGALDSQPQVIKLTSCFPMVGCSLRVLWLLPLLKLVGNDIAEILPKEALSTINQIKSNFSFSCSAT